MSQKFYDVWYIVNTDNDKLASVWLKQNTIRNHVYLKCFSFLKTNVSRKL